MKRIAVFTGTRAEYGLLHPLLKLLKKDDEVDLKLIVTGTHLSPEFGLTYKQIEEDGFNIDEKIEVLLSSDTATGVAKSVGLAVISYSDALTRLDAEMIIILGDRYEALAMAQTAMLLRIPIVHLHGGEITEGAYDDAIRHAITKLSHLHFASNEQHRKRIIQLGESPDRVFNVGAIGLDNIFNAPLMSKDELAESINFDLTKPFFLLTYHPVTLASEDPIKSFNTIITAIDSFPHYNVIVTYPNADDGGRKIISCIEAWAATAKNKERIKVVPSLGFKRYLSAVKYSSTVIGNSSSGVIEVPSLNVSSVNIGERQKGRISAPSVLHCPVDKQQIIEAIQNSIEITDELKAGTKTVKNPYGNGDTSKKIVELLKITSPDIQKKFFDID